MPAAVPASEADAPSGSDQPLATAVVDEPTVVPDYLVAIEPAAVAEPPAVTGDAAVPVAATEPEPGYFTVDVSAAEPVELEAPVVPFLSIGGASIAELVQTPAFEPGALAAAATAPNLPSGAAAPGPPAFTVVGSSASAAGELAAIPIAQDNMTVEMEPAAPPPIPYAVAETHMETTTEAPQVETAAPAVVAPANADVENGAVEPMSQPPISTEVVATPVHAVGGRGADADAARRCRPRRRDSLRRRAVEADDSGRRRHRAARE